MKCKCPLCDGTGEVERIPEVEKVKQRRLEKELAIKLKTEGFTIRKIASVLGYKHPGSISNLLKLKK